MEDFTKEELEILIKYLDHKIVGLEVAGLTDSYCYPRLYSARRKLQNILKNSLQNK